MNITCLLEFEFDSEELAMNIANSIKIDDGDFVDTKTEGNKISALISSETIPSLLHTLEDYLSCISVAEKSALTCLREP